MFLLLRTSLRSTLLLTCGILLSQAASVEAQNGHQEIQPIPESQQVQGSCPNCQKGNTYQGNDGYSDGYSSCPNCQNGYNDRAGRSRVSPGSGWCPPSKVAIQRQRVQYQKYYPNYWSGYGAGYAQQYAPMVHTPTDTTQLGFYYQHTPTWTAQPWRIPGAAHPASWHNRYCNQRGRQNRNYDQRYRNYGQQYYDQGSYCPTCQPNSEQTEALQVIKKAPASIKVPEPAAAVESFKYSLLPDVPPEV